MHLLNMTRPALIELALSKLPRRYRRRADEQGSSLRCLGVFRADDVGCWYVGLRFGRPKARALYAQMYELRREGGWSVLATAAPGGLPWRWWREDLCDRESVPVCRRLRRLAQKVRPNDEQD